MCPRYKYTTDQMNAFASIELKTRLEHNVQELIINITASREEYKKWKKDPPLRRPLCICYLTRPAHIWGGKITALDKTILILNKILQKKVEQADLKYLEDLLENNPYVKASFFKKNCIDLIQKALNLTNEFTELNRIDAGEGCRKKIAADISRHPRC